MTQEASAGPSSAGTRLAGIVGWPVVHSLSPVIHSYWIRKHRLDAAYVPLPVRPGHLATALRALPALGFRGCNVTVPHKVEARSLVDEESALAGTVGAVNTIFVRDGRLIGANTDVGGFVAGLHEQRPEWHRSGRRAVVVGAGGAARAIVAGLRAEHGDEIVIANRTLAKAEEIAAQFEGVRAVGLRDLEAELTGAGLLVNASTLGMGNGPTLDPDLAGLAADAVVADIVYVPLETALLRGASRRGLATVDGLGMLLHQAVPGFEGWFGVRPVVDHDLRKHVLATLEK